ncbi:hypothetical protein D3C87_84810 [compost metagenome]
MVSLASFVCSFPSVAFSGSRVVGSSASVSCGAFLPVLAGFSASVGVGCASGVDSLVRSAFPSACVFSVQQFAVGGRVCRASFARRSSALVSWSDRNPLISKKNFVDDDSLIVSFKEDGRLEINDTETGVWNLKNDSLLLSGNKEFREFPLFLDTKYEVHKSKFSKNWYFYCTFYSSDRKTHHTVKYSARKRGTNY